MIIIIISSIIINDALIVKHREFKDVVLEDVVFENK